MGQGREGIRPQLLEAHLSGLGEASGGGSLLPKGLGLWGGQDPEWRVRAPGGSAEEGWTWVGFRR